MKKKIKKVDSPKRILKKETSRAEYIVPKNKGKDQEIKQGLKKRYEKAELSKIIEKLRGQLVLLAKEEGLSSNEVVELSQQLDKYIVLFQSRMHEKSVDK
ncbi:aspartyl-phosphate phosphatase Spo0E family protein [Brevibacillus ruminantium]|uniref:Aspartyl-phosphate phosphatase Spo0E family protein n=1 Tax=Brevibacillus ruminantium TaxID=2950604 RepID=A0ABY4WG44_9BACL|nr:aspartyl-phosphate phosphatase Spo0E family protein [Brevibacillus ruminantium]USG65829.1 aspartyl-phosphate phosphatase Spo0E family protein [Brevibacillus ruminantium]